MSGAGSGSQLSTEELTLTCLAPLPLELLLLIEKIQQNSYRSCDLPKKWNHVDEASCPTIFGKRSHQCWCQLFRHKSDLMLTSVGSQLAYFLVHLCKYIRTTPRQTKTLDTQLSTLQYSNPGEGILLVKKNASTDFAALVNIPFTNKVFAKRVGPCNTFICLYVRTCICLFHTFNNR